MSGTELRRIRRAFGLSKHRFAQLIGLDGNEGNNVTRVKNWEQGWKPIPITIARLAWMLWRAGDNDGVIHVGIGYLEGALLPTPVWPEWPPYEGRKAMSAAARSAASTESETP